MLAQVCLHLQWHGGGAAAEAQGGCEVAEVDRGSRATGRRFGKDEGEER